MLKRIASHGISIYAVTFFLEKLSFLLINLYLLKKLNVDDFAVFTIMFTWSGFIGLFADFGSSIIYVNNHKEFGVRPYVYQRLSLWLPAVLISYIVFDNFLITFFIACYSIEYLAKFPQYFQISNRNMKYFYGSQLAKAVALICVVLFWGRMETITLHNAVFSIGACSLLSVLIVASFAGKYLLCVPRLTEKFFRESFSKGGQVLISQLLLWTRQGVFLLVAASYFKDYLKEVRIYLILFNIIQQIVMVYFQAIYPKLVAGTFSIKKKVLYGMAGLMTAGILVSFMVKDAVWAYVFSNVEITAYNDIIFYLVSLSIPLNIAFVWAVAYVQSKNSFFTALVINAAGAVASVGFVVAAVMFKSYPFILPVIISYDVVGLITFFVFSYYIKQRGNVTLTTKKK